MLCCVVSCGHTTSYKYLKVSYSIPVNCDELQILQLRKRDKERHTPQQANLQMQELRAYFRSQWQVLQNEKRQEHCRCGSQFLL